MSKLSDNFNIDAAVICKTSSESIENGELSESGCLASNISAAELDEETNTKLRGDVIGDTLYSQTFVLKTLLKFRGLEWTEQIEEDLCFLWDMTIEKDVCQYLFEISFPSIACAAISTYTENRFIEILIGILANILCADCDKNISQEEISIIIQELNSDDHLILIQVMRFICALSHNSENLSFITEDTISKIKFILSSSLDNDLLIKSLETVAKITSNYKIDKNLVNVELFTAAMVSYKTIQNKENEHFQFDSKEKQMTCKYMLEAVSNICSYIDQFENNQLLLEIQTSSKTFIKEVIKITQYFSQNENLLPVTDEFIFFMSVFKYVLITIGISYISDLFISLTKIFFIILPIKDEVIDLFEDCLELQCFLISRCNLTYIQKDLNFLSKNEVQILFNLVNENKSKYEFSLEDL